MLRLIRLPKGPTFWFRVKQYSLIQDIVKLQYPQFVNTKKFKKMKQNKCNLYLPDAIQGALHFAPLVILNGFGAHSHSHQTDQQQAFGNKSAEKHNRVEAYHKQLMSVMFKHMFAPMNVIKMKLSQCKRVVFFNYDCERDCVQVRHYRIQLASDLKGVSKGIKKIMKAKRVRLGSRSNVNDALPDLSGYEDVTDYVEQNENENENASENESELDDDDQHTKVVHDRVQQHIYNYNKGEHDNTSFVRLQEIGPRMSLQLIKIEELLNDGKVLYHRYVQKTEQERRELQESKDRHTKLKQERRVTQQLNVQRKQDMKKEAQIKKVESRKHKEIANLLQSFDTKEDGDGQQQNKKQSGQKRAILKESTSGDHDGGQPKKKRVRF